MSRFLHLQLLLPVSLCLIAPIAIGPNAATRAVATHSYIADSSHGPTMPPDPWAGEATHGPTMPPDPWAGEATHGPTMPPDPWAGEATHGPTMPPDPWAGIV